MKPPGISLCEHLASEYLGKVQANLFFLVQAWSLNPVTDFTGGSERNCPLASQGKDGLRGHLKRHGIRL